MKYSAVLFLIVIFSLTATAQKPKSSTKTSKSPTKTKLAKTSKSSTPTKAKSTNTKTAAKKLGSETEEFEKAVALTDAPKRIKALQKFIENFSESGEIVRAQELIVSARAELGDEKLQAGEIEKGIQFFKLAVKDAPKPMSEKLFADVILQFPTNLFFRSQRAAAVDIAKLIEEKAEGNSKQLLGLATFYLGIESASQARRLANKAIEIETASPSEISNLPVAYQTLGLANRLGFQLEESANAYAKALELDAESIVSRRSLAEMKRATGKFDEAITLYRELIAKDENDLTAKTGLTLSLFDAGKREEAEAEMKQTLEANENNLFLLVGAAYWYAAQNNGTKAVELARQALTIEPRYTWAYIAMGRGFMAQKLPLEAEKVLLTARNYGSFPTLDYEIAAARLQAGFYREAADELKKNFAIKNGTLETRLGGRITVEAEDFIKLLALERQASIFQPNPADTAETAQKLKSLLTFSQEINSPDENLEAISAATDDFVKGDDKMKIHRQLFVATRLLDKKKALPKVLEMTQAAVSGVDSALDVVNPSAAVMADELYETRILAMSRNEVLIVPEIPRQTLSVILRGRIEEITGWTLYQQDKAAEAVIRLKRAVSVLPKKSSWWRSSVWRLGTALEADGKPEEALENYVKAYTSSEQPDATKYIFIESLYQKVNGSAEGLEKKIGVKPAGVSDAIAKATEKPDDTPTAVSNAIQETKGNVESENSLSPLPSPESQTETATPIKVETSPTPKVEEPKPDDRENPTPATDSAETKSPETEVKTSQPENPPLPEITPELKVSATPEVMPSPVPDSKESPPVEDKQTTVEATPIPTPENLPETETEIKTVPTLEPTATPEVLKTTENPPPVDAAPTPTPEPETKPDVSATPQIEEVSLNNPEEAKPSTATELPAPTPEIQPPPAEISRKKEKLSVIVTENSPSKPVKKQTENAEKKSPEISTDSKQGFEPVIINLPKVENTNKPKTRRNIPENPPVFAKQKTNRTQSENNLEETAETQEKIVNPDASIVTRPRVVIEDNLKNLTPETKKPQCKISVSQENISLINNGGSIGILIELSGDSVEELTAVTSSPQDIRAVPDPEFGNIPGRVFFIIKSISDKIGIYTVTMESACGKKEIQVRVR